METCNQIHTRAQMRAARNAANSHILETADLNDDTNLPLHVRNDTPAVPATDKSRENSTLLPTILLPCATSCDDLAAARPFVEHDEPGINLHANLADYCKLEIAKALPRHSVKMGLPKHYATNHFFGVKAKKSRRRKLS